MSLARIDIALIHSQRHSNIKEHRKQAPCLNAKASSKLPSDPKRIPDQINKIPDERQELVDESSSGSGESSSETDIPIIQAMRTKGIILRLVVLLYSTLCHADLLPKVINLFRSSTVRPDERRNCFIRAATRFRMIESSSNSSTVLTE